jgi:hypothetical protein
MSHSVHQVVKLTLLLVLVIRSHIQMMLMVSSFNTDCNFWEYITNEDPERGQRFGRAMRAVTLNTLQAIPSMYPFDQLAMDGGVLVDVGGGLGQVGKLIVSHFPHCGLKCVVQDKFADNLTAPIKAGIQMQRHDFFEPQPIRGK